MNKPNFFDFNTKRTDVRCTCHITKFFPFWILWKKITAIAARSVPGQMKALLGDIFVIFYITVTNKLTASQSSDKFPLPHLLELLYKVFDTYNEKMNGIIITKEKVMNVQHAMKPIARHINIVPGANLSAFIASVSIPAKYQSSYLNIH